MPRNIKQLNFPHLPSQTASDSTLQDENGEGDGDGCRERRYLPQSAARRRLATSQQRPRNRADIDSDGKAEDVGRLGLRQQRMITARGVKAHSPLTGAVRRRPKTPKFTVRIGQQDEGTTRSRRRTAGQTVRRGGKTAFSYVGNKVKPVRQDYGSYGSGATRRTLTSRAFSQCVNTRILRSQGAR
ncbi:hypothetical protein CF326_g2372 [Tilletia indica]|nr:hypothetical protein CF326_g2372 [Tilletia indica]